MKAHLYTVHRKGERGMRVVGDGVDWLALVLWPAWLLWHGLWISAGVVVVLLVVAAAVTPFAVLPAACGIGLICTFEGASIIRAELRLRGWREAGCVEARSAAGAEELYLTGTPA